MEVVQLPVSVAVVVASGRPPRVSVTVAPGSQPVPLTVATPPSTIVDGEIWIDGPAVGGVVDGSVGSGPSVVVGPGAAVVEVVSGAVEVVVVGAVVEEVDDVEEVVLVVELVLVGVDVELVLLVDDVLDVDDVLLVEEDVLVDVELELLVLLVELELLVLLVDPVVVGPPSTVTSAESVAVTVTPRSTLRAVQVATLVVSAFTTALSVMNALAPGTRVKGKSARIVPSWSSVRSWRGRVVPPVLVTR
jgi:hypothetical protein